jgi:AcrR family transcriptional regulator
MTEIAERAGASIGALYQYFPNKEALAEALGGRLGEQMAARWESLEPDFAALPAPRLAARLVDVMAGFMERHPAYLPLLEALPGRRRDSEARERFRAHFGELLRRRQPGLGPEEALRRAKVLIQLLKGLKQAFLEVDAAQRPAIRADFTDLVAWYLEARVDGSSGSLNK